MTRNVAITGALATGKATADSMTHRHTLHVVVDLDKLPAVIAAIEGLGGRVECAAHDARERLRERDELLRRAHALMPGASCYAQCERLAEQIEKFERRWPALREQESPPEGNPARSLLFQARQCGELPGSPRQLYTIVQGRDTLKRDGAGNFNGEHV